VFPDHSGRAATPWGAVLEARKKKERVEMVKSRKKSDDRRGVSSQTAEKGGRFICFDSGGGKKGVGGWVGRMGGG